MACSGGAASGLACPISDSSSEGQADCSVPGGEPLDNLGISTPEIEPNNRLNEKGGSQLEQRELNSPSTVYAQHSNDEPKKKVSAGMSS